MKKNGRKSVRKQLGFTRGSDTQDWCELRKATGSRPSVMMEFRRLQKGLRGAHVIDICIAVVDGVGDKMW